MNRERLNNREVAKNIVGKTLSIPQQQQDHQNHSKMITTMTSTTPRRRRLNNSTTVPERITRNEAFERMLNDKRLADVILKS